MVCTCRQRLIDIECAALVLFLLLMAFDDERYFHCKISRDRFRLHCLCPRATFSHALAPLNTLVSSITDHYHAPLPSHLRRLAAIWLLRKFAHQLSHMRRNAIIILHRVFDYFVGRW